jgi:amino acid transporter
MSNELKVGKDVVSLWSFILGLASVVFAFIGVIPITAFVLGVIGLNRTKDKPEKGRWMAITGLILGIAFTLVYMSSYGHI